MPPSLGKYPLFDMLPGLAGGGDVLPRCMEYIFLAGISISEMPEEVYLHSGADRTVQARAFFPTF